MRLDEQDSSLDLYLSDQPRMHSYRGYLLRFGNIYKQLTENQVDSADLHRAAVRLCRLSRFLLFAALRERVSEEESNAACKLMRSASRLLAEAPILPDKGNLRQVSDRIGEYVDLIRTETAKVRALCP